MLFAANSRFTSETCVSRESLLPCHVVRVRVVAICLAPRMLVQLCRERRREWSEGRHVLSCRNALLQQSCVCACFSRLIREAPLTPLFRRRGGGVVDESNWRRTPLSGRVFLHFSYTFLPHLFLSFASLGFVVLGGLDRFFTSALDIVLWVCIHTYFAYLYLCLVACNHGISFRFLALIGRGCAESGVADTNVSSHTPPCTSRTRNTGSYTFFEEGAAPQIVIVFVLVFTSCSSAQTRCVWPAAPKS